MFWGRCHTFMQMDEYRCVLEPLEPPHTQNSSIVPTPHQINTHGKVFKLIVDFKNYDITHDSK